MDRARASEARGREFESPQPHHFFAKPSAPSKNLKGAPTRKIKGGSKGWPPANFVKQVQALKLDVATVAPIHGIVVPYSDVQKAASSGKG
jgi:hypothetical protein